METQINEHFVKTTTPKQGKNYIGTFASLEQMSTYAQGGGTKTTNFESHKPPSIDWCKETFDETVRLATYGWPEGREKMSRQVEIATNAVTHARQPRWTNDVCGFFPNINRYNAGLPDCMTNVAKGFKKRRPIVRVLFDYAVSWMVKSDQIIGRGAALMSYIDKLEDMGTQVELTAIESCSGGGTKLCLTQFTAKRAGEPLDIDRLAFVTTHPGMLRRVWFAVMERTPDLDSSICEYSYGTPIALTKTQIRQIYSEPCVYIPAIRGNTGGGWSDPATAMEMMGKLFDAAIDPASDDDTPDQGGEED